MKTYLTAFSITLVRYYDYAIFGMSASVLAKNLMPGHNESDQMLGFFSIFSISFIARPIGAFILSKIGDEVGRTSAVKLSNIIGAVSTALIAFIPNYSVVGWLSLVMLSLCRMFFLATLAGESDVIKIYISELISPKLRHFGVSIVSFSAQIGVLIATIMNFIATSSNVLDGQLWRMNFIIGGIAGLILLKFYHHMHEADIFTKHKKEGNKIDITTALLDNRYKFLLSLLISGCAGGGYHFIIVFFSSFLSNSVGILSLNEMSSLNIQLVIIYAFANLLSGYISDKYSTNYIIIISLLISIFTACYMLVTMSYGGYIRILHFILVFMIPFYTIPIQVKIHGLYETLIRARMCSLAHAMGSSLIGAHIPLISILVWKHSNNIYLVTMNYIILLMIIFISISVIIYKNYNSEL